MLLRSRSPVLLILAPNKGLRQVAGECALSKHSSELLTYYRKGRLCVCFTKCQSLTSEEVLAEVLCHAPRFFLCFHSQFRDFTT